MQADRQNHVNGDEDSINPLGVLLLLAEHARLLVAAPMLLGLCAVAISFAITPTYTARTLVLLPHQQQSAANMLATQLTSTLGIASAAIGTRSAVDTHLAILSSKTVADRIIDRFDLTKRYEKRYRQQVRDVLKGMVRINASPKDGSIKVEVSESDPKLAAAMANAYVEEGAALAGRLILSEAQSRRAFFERQVKAADENLKKAQRALGDSAVPPTVIMSAPQALVEGLAQLRARITAHEIKMSSMRTYLTERSPEYLAAEQELSALRAQLNKTAATEPGERSNRPDYLDRLRDYKYYEALYELMVKQYEGARLEEARDIVSVQVVDVAEPPELPSAPRKRVIVLATVGTTFFLVLMFVLLREYFRSISHDQLLARAVASLRRAAFLRG